MYNIAILFFFSCVFVVQGRVLIIAKSHGSFCVFYYRVFVSVMCERRMFRELMNLMVQRCNILPFHLGRKKQSFAPTRPSSVLIEQLAVCVDKGESVLLVGETGTGKTSAVQYLAQITGKVQYWDRSQDTVEVVTQEPIHHLLYLFVLREPFESYQHEPAKWYCRSSRRVSG